MKTFRTRQDVIDFATGNAPTRACQRWMETTGELAVFGGIKSPEGFPGWIVQVNRHWLIGVFLNIPDRKVVIQYPKGFPDTAVEIKRPIL